MKFFLSLGGSIGFLGVFFSSLHAGNEIGFALRNGAIGCLAGAFLMRGFHRVMIFCIKSLVEEETNALDATRPASLSSNGMN
jgi:hypothetical protein